MPGDPLAAISLAFPHRSWYPLRSQRRFGEMKRNRWINTGLLVLLGIGLVAYTTEKGLGLPSTASMPYPPPGFAHRQSTMAVELFWNCTYPTPDTLLLQGVAVNLVESEVRSLEFSVVGVDSHGSAVSEITDTSRNIVLSTMQSTPIQLKLQMKGSEVRFDLYYQYQAPVPRVAVDRPVLVAQGMNRLMIRDVCSETLHRVH
jgi:hypothetical protein